MIPAKVLSRLSSSLFLCFCAAGLLWQLVTVTEEYFRYKVITSTIIFIPDTIKPTAITMCFNLFNVLNLVSLKRDMKIFLDKNNGQLTKEQLINNLTIRQLFDYTPSNDSIVSSMTYKLKNQSHPEVVSRGNLSILKFLRQFNVCYKIQVKSNKESLSYRENSISNAYQFVLTQLFFTKYLNNVQYISAIISSVDYIPYQELISTPFIFRRLSTSNGSAEASSNAYTSDHMTWERILLPSPYETHCTPYEEQGFQSRDHCINDCITSQVWKS